MDKLNNEFKKVERECPVCPADGYPILNLMKVINGWAYHNLQCYKEHSKRKDAKKKGRYGMS